MAIKESKQDMQMRTMLQMRRKKGGGPLLRFIKITMRNKLIITKK